MDLQKLHLLEAHEVVELLRTKQVTPLELLDVVEQRVAATESAVHATPITCFERARERAKQLPEMSGKGCLHGLPILVKDTEAVEGVLFTEGSLLHAERVATDSSPLVAQLEAMGAIVAGKTNVPEFCAGAQCFNELFPTSRSPYDTRTTAGGSSGGSAAALASYQCWLATGTDHGGSLRTPAAFCGCVGFRPSVGRTPTQQGKALRNLHSVAGPMGRSVRDVGLFLDAMDSFQGWEGFLEPLVKENFEEAAVLGSREGAKVQVGFATMGLSFAPEVEALCRAAAGLLNEDREVPEIGSVDFALASKACAALRAQTFVKKYGDLPLERLKPEIRWNVAQGQVSDMDSKLRKARMDHEKVLEQVSEMFKSIDILCTPATLDAAFDASVRYPTEQAGQSFSDYMGFLQPVSIVSLLLCPALVLPCGFKDGRPVGLQMVAPYGQDALLLRCAAALERRLDLPKLPAPRCGTAALDTVGPRSALEAAEHHGI